MQSRSYHNPSSHTLDRVCLQHRPHCASSPPAQIKLYEHKPVPGSECHSQGQHCPHKSHEFSWSAFLSSPAAARYWLLLFWRRIRLRVAVTPCVGAGWCCCASPYECRELQQTTILPEINLEQQQKKSHILSLFSLNFCNEKWHF